MCTVESQACLYSELRKTGFWIFFNVLPAVKSSCASLKTELVKLGMSWSTSYHLFQNMA